MRPLDLSDDDELLELLAECLDAADPVPDAAVEAAKAAASLDDADVELASLVADSLLDADTVLLRHDLTMERLGEVSDRLVSFTTPRLSVDVDLPADGGTVVGAIAPPAIVLIDLETTRGTVTTTSDELGRFHLDAGPGRCRLRIHADDGAVVTPWITR